MGDVNLVPVTVNVPKASFDAADAVVSIVEKLKAGENAMQAVTEDLAKLSTAVTEVGQLSAEAKDLADEAVLAGYLGGRLAKAFLSK